MVFSIGSQILRLRNIPQEWLSSEPGKRLLKFHTPSTIIPESVFNLNIVDTVILPRQVHFKKRREISWYHDTESNRQYFITPEMKSCIDWDKRELQLELLSPSEFVVLSDIEKVLIQLRLLISFLTVKAGGLPLHSSAVFRNSMALVFFGHSGSGKTTIARIMANSNWHLLNDEYNIVMVENGLLRVYSTPFTRRAPELINEPGGISVNNLFQLGRGTFAIKAIPLEKQITFLLQSVYLFPEFGSNGKRLLDNVITVCSKRPPRILDFENNPGTAVILDKHCA